MVQKQRKGRDDPSINLNEVAREAQLLLNMLPDGDHPRKNTKLYRFARAIVAFKVEIKALEDKMTTLYNEYQDLKLEYHKLERRIDDRLKEIEARFALLKATAVTPVKEV